MGRPSFFELLSIICSHTHRESNNTAASRVCQFVLSVLYPTIYFSVENTSISGAPGCEGVVNVVRTIESYIGHVFERDNDSVQSC